MASALSSALRRRGLVAVALVTCSLGVCIPASLASAGTSSSGNVAVVGNVAITSAQLSHWLVVANDAGQPSSGKAAAPLPVPPDYSACVGALKSQSGSASTSSLKASCASRYQKLMGSVMAFLIQGIWLQGEANARGLSVTKAQIDAAYNEDRRTSKPALTSTAALNAFLAASGETVADVRWRIQLQLVTAAISARVDAGAAKVTSSQISAYYDSHRSHYIGQTPGQAKQAIAKTLEAANRTAVEKKFSTQFSATWKARTVCAKAFSTPLCGKTVDNPQTVAGSSYPGSVTPAPSQPQTAQFVPTH